MRLKFQKTVALLILSAFLATIPAGNVLGCTECVGCESSQRVNALADKECGADERIYDHDDSHDVPAIDQFGDEQHGSCPDCSISQGSTVFSKRTKRIPTAATVPVILKDFSLTSATSIKLVVGNLAPQPPTKTSQTLLAHRTVVLLN
jgi:hypothetical protein